MYRGQFERKIDVDCIAGQPKAGVKFETGQCSDRVRGFSPTNDFLDPCATNTDFAVLADIEFAASETILDDRGGLPLNKAAAGRSKPSPST